MNVPWAVSPSVRSHKITVNALCLTLQNTSDNHLHFSPWKSLISVLKFNVKEFLLKNTFQQIIEFSKNSVKSRDFMASHMIPKSRLSVAMKCHEPKAIQKAQVIALSACLSENLLKVHWYGVCEFVAVWHLRKNSFSFNLHNTEFSGTFCIGFLEEIAIEMEWGGKRIPAGVCKIAKTVLCGLTFRNSNEKLSFFFGVELCILAEKKANRLN